VRLVFEHTSKLYGSTVALEPMDLALSCGVYGLLGPNGAGKTTFMRIMTDLLAPSTGRVLLDEKDISVLGGEYRKRLGYLPQDFGVYPNFTAEQFLLYIGRLKGLSKFEAKRQADELLSLVGLEEKRRKKLNGFSGGQRQRIGIARALYYDPEVLILDEATSALDNDTEAAIMDSINRLHGRKTLVIIAHRLQTIEKCDVVYRVEDGKIRRN